MTRRVGPHRRVFHYAGAFRCLDCGRRWGWLLDGAAPMPQFCVAPAPPPAHRCHWPGCKTIVSPRLWGCKYHWFRLPVYLRKRIKASYRPGQEASKRPSKDYLAAARDVRDWIEKNN